MPDSLWAFGFLLSRDAGKRQGQLSLIAHIGCLESLIGGGDDFILVCVDPNHASPQKKFLRKNSNVFGQFLPTLHLPEDHRTLTCLPALILTQPISSRDRRFEPLILKFLLFSLDFGSESNTAWVVNKLIKKKVREEKPKTYYFKKRTEVKQLFLLL